MKRWSISKQASDLTLSNILNTLSHMVFNILFPYTPTL